MTIETFHSEQFRVGPKDEPDRYRLGVPVGAGTEGTLYRGSLTIDQGLVLDVAIKMLHPHHRPNLAVWRRRWTDQVELLRSLRAPGLVAVRDGFMGALPHHSDEADGADTLYLVMNYVEGAAIDTWAANHPEVPDREKLRLLLPIAAGLDLMHSGAATGGIPVIHGDVKPGNVLVAEGHGTILVDFGMMRSLPGGVLQTSIAGTPNYLAPEVTTDGIYTPAADRYAFGGVAFYLLTGGHPTGDSAEMRDALEAGGRDPEMVDHVLRMFLPAEQRPLSLANWCAQLRDSSLEAALSPGTLAPPAPPRRRAGAQLPTASTPPPAPRPAGEPAPAPSQGRSRVRLRLTFVAVLALAMAAGAIIAARPGRSSPGPRAVFTFPPAAYANGLVSIREWSLSGPQTDRLHARLRVINGSSGPVTGTVDELVTKAVAARVTVIRFRPGPDLVVRTDPVVVRYSVVDLQPLHAVDFVYDIPVPRGPAELSRLQVWAAAQTVEEADYYRETPAAPAILATLQVTPPTLSLPVGQSYQLSPEGGMSDGTPASALVLSGVAWSSSDPATVGVAGGRVTANRTGTATVSAQAGTLRADVRVTATAATTTPASPTSQPAAQPPVTYQPPPITIDPTPGSTGPPATEASQPPPTRSRQSQPILFTPPPAAVAATSAALSATGGGSTRPVMFSVDASSGAGVCEVGGANGATVQYLIAGSCVINADQAGDDTYADAPRVQRTVLVALAPQTIDFHDPGGGVVGGTGNLSATGGPSGRPVVFSVDGSATGVCSVSGATVTYRLAGNCVVNADQAGDATYAPAPRVSRTIEVLKASQTITFTPPAGAEAGTTLALAAAGGGSAHPVVFSVAATSGVGVCSVSGVNGSTLSLAAAGTWSSTPIRPETPTTSPHPGYRGRSPSPGSPWWRSTTAPPPARTASPSPVPGPPPWAMRTSTRGRATPAAQPTTLSNSPSPAPRRSGGGRWLPTRASPPSRSTVGRKPSSTPTRRRRSTSSWCIRRRPSLRAPTP